MVAPAAAGRGRGRPVRERVAQVFLLQHLPELLRAPVGDEELQPGPVPQPAVAVVTEHRRDRRPHLGDLVGLDERAEALGDHRVGGQPAAHPQVVAGLAVRAGHADERHVVDLVHGALRGAAAHHRLVLAGQVGEGRVAHVAGGDLVDLRASRRSPRRRRSRPAGSPAPPGACRRRPPWWTGPPPPGPSQIAGTSSILIQCSWMFCRSVRSAVPRAYRRGDAGRSCAAGRGSAARRRCGSAA